MKQMLTKWVVWLLIERPASWRSFNEIAQILERSGEKLNARFSSAQSSSKTIETLRHIIAIEKWGQSRLKTVLGEPLQEDTNHDHKPAEDSSFESLVSMFAATRQETIEIAQQIATKDKAQQGMQVPHNQFGSLHVKGWFRYLNTHASIEGKSVR